MKEDKVERERDDFEKNAGSVAVLPTALTPNSQRVTGLVDIKNDFVFKNVFGVEDSKDLLSSFLSAVLKKAWGIEEITILNSEFPKMGAFMAGMRFDVRVKLGNSTYCNIEIQCYKNEETMERPVDQVCRMVYADMTGGQEKVRPTVVGIWITDKDLTGQPGYFHKATFHYEQTEERPATRMTDRVQMIFLELNKFRPKNLDEKNKLDVWLAFLKNPDSQKIPEGPEIKKARRKLEILRADPVFKEELMDVELALREQRIEKELSRKEGKEEKAREMALSLINQGVSFDIIAKASGFTVEEVENLAKSLP